MAAPPSSRASSGLTESLKQEMARWEAQGLRRTLVSAESRGGRVDFASNDYLGLARDPAILAAAQKALDDHGAGGRASRLLGGGSPLHEEAEMRCAEWLGAEAALLFPSGYQANLALLSSLAKRGDALFSDALNHASLIDGARLSRARVHVHDHLDYDELERQLAREKDARRRLVVTEGLFSMEGDTPDLVRLNEICLAHDAWLVLDEAHSVGVLGPEGAGAWAASELDAGEHRLAARVVTAGKALGVAGAFVVSPDEVREHLINRGRAFLFTTAPSPALAGALVAAIERCRAAESERELLRTRASDLASRLGRPVPAGAILPCKLGDPEAAVELMEALVAKGFDARAVRPPTVPPGAAGLRLVVHAHNTESEIDELARELAQAPHGADVVAATAKRDVSRSLFVVGTDTDIGKTVVSALLLSAARTQGPAAYWKPVQTGDDSDTETVRELSGASKAELMRPAWHLPLPASPHYAAEEAGVEIHPEPIEEGLHGLLRTLGDTRLVVELAGGLLVPYRLEPLATQADWLERARPPFVLVARSGLGTLNHTLLTLEALRRRHLEPEALFLVGEKHTSNRDTLARVSGVRRIYEVPKFERLQRDTLDAWIAEQGLGELFGG